MTLPTRQAPTTRAIQLASQSCSAVYVPFSRIALWSIGMTSLPSAVVHDSLRAKLYALVLSMFASRISRADVQRWYWNE